MRTDSPCLRVLVVDDCKDTAHSSAILLTSCGHEARIAYDGPTALEMARTHRPDVILLDIGLPGRTGWEVAGDLRQLPEFQGVLLIAISGYARDEDRQRSREMGIDVHLAKPADPDELRRLLEPPAKARASVLLSLTGIAG